MVTAAGDISNSVLWKKNTATVSYMNVLITTVFDVNVTEFLELLTASINGVQVSENLQQADQIMCMDLER